MKSIFKKRKLLIFSILILVGLFLYTSVSASALPWFGGMITKVTPCTCSMGSQVTVVGFPSIFSGTYLYQAGVAQAKGKSNVIPNKFVVGTYIPGGVCFIGVPPECSTLPITKGVIGTISTN